jgi:hypothetical protein
MTYIGERALILVLTGVREVFAHEIKSLFRFLFIKNGELVFFPDEYIAAALLFLDSTHFYIELCLS